ncbi:hypothetical protein RB600_005212 [Gaeumannomyces tritici]
MDRYIHRPIDLSKKAIRLLRLCGADREDAINCELFQSFLEEDQDVHVEYEALSYTWSDTADEDHRLGEASQPKCISIEGLPFQVTNNLYLALKHLRLRDSDRILWVDAVCIDQDKDEEKNHQVGQMNIVYSSAENVIIWLGPGSPAISWLFYACTKLHQHAVRRCPARGQTPLDRWKAVWRSLDQLSEGNAALVTEHSYSALEAVLRRPWFGRVWVVQEVALARRATVVCGWSSAPTSSFALMPGLLRVEVPELTRAVLDVMPGPLRNEETSWWKDGRDLFTMLRKFGGSASSRAHDRIYALLGISSDPNIIKPKYQAAEHEAVEDVLKLAVLEHGNLPEHVRFPQWSVDELITNLRPGDHLEGEDIEQRLLLWAVRSHEKGLAEHLLGRQSRFLIPNGTKRPPQPILHLLAETPGSHGLVRAFARRKGTSLDFNCRFGCPGETALQCALRNGNPEVADALLEAQNLALDKFKSDCAQGYRDLNMASASCGKEPQPVVSPLTNSPTLQRLQRDDMMYMETAARRGRTSDLEYFLSRMPAVAPPSALALRLAIESGCKSAVELLIQHGADVNEPSGLWTPLDVAAMRDDVPVAELLLDRKADPNRGSPLYWAVRNGGQSMARRLVVAGADLHAVFGRESPLQAAVEAKNIEMAALLLESEDDKHNSAMSTDGAVGNNTCRDLNHQHNFKALGKLLGGAIASKNKKAARLLLDHKASLSIDRWSDEGPNLWVAAWKGYTSAAMTILDSPPPGFDVNEGSSISRTTPLFKAANRGDEDLVRALLEHGADMEIRDCGGATPLWAASNKGHPGCVRILLEAGADTDARAQSFQGFGPTTPRRIAEGRGFGDIAALIARHTEVRKMQNKGRKRPATSPVGHPHRGYKPRLLAGRVPK